MLDTSAQVLVYAQTNVGRSIYVGTAGWAGLQYTWTFPVTQDDLGLAYPGASATFWLHFQIPLQPDRDTCTLNAVYSAPVLPAPTPQPTPLPTPQSTPPPNPGPISTIFTITAGQQTTITQPGTPGTDIEYQTSLDLFTWYWLGPRLTIPASGSATYTFAPAQTAYYRAYFYATGTTNNPVRGVVLPNATPTPTPMPAPVATIYTINWGQSTSISTQGQPGAPVQFQSSLDNVAWSTFGTAVVDTTGSAGLTFRPQTNLFLRSEVAGRTGLSVRGVVRQIVLLRPTNSGRTRVLNRGATVVFASTIRPQTRAPSVARFRIYRWTGASWALFTERRVSADASNVARLTWTFTKSGRWYVRAMADPTVYNANSSWSPIERYDVR